MRVGASSMIGVACLLAASLALPVASADPGVPSDSIGGQVSVVPSRLVDTRVGRGLAAAIPAHGSASIYVVDAALNAGVEFRVTAVKPAASGYLTVYPGTSRPESMSSENFARGRTVSNLVFVTQSSTGDVSLFNGSAAPLQIVLDETGVVPAGVAPLAGMFASTGTGRVLDTRTGTGVVRGPLAVHHSLTVQAVPNGAYVGGNTGPIPVSAAIVNLSAVNPTTSGYVTAYAADTLRPPTSTLSFSPGAVTDNLAVVPVDADGQITIYNGSASGVHLTVDIEGLYLGAVGVPSVFESLQPVPAARVADSRYGFGATPVPAHGAVRVPVAGRGGLSSTATGAALLTVTAVDPATGGYLEVYPGGVARPVATSVNFSAGTNTASTSIVPVAPDGTVDVYNSSVHPVNFIVDVAGYYLSAPLRRPDPLTWTPAPVTFPTTAEGSTFSVSDLSCPTSAWCAAIGGGTVDTFSRSGFGISYTLDASDHSRDQGDISCGTPTFCIASTSTGYFRFDGATWRQVASSVQYTHLDCTGDSFCLATDGARAAVLDGRQWHPISGPAASPIDVVNNGGRHLLSCASPTFCMYVGSDGYASSYNGTEWSAPTLADPAGALPDSQFGPFALSCPTADFCMIVDHGNNAIIYSHGTFTSPYNLDDAVSGDSGNVEAVSCTSDAFCAATDGNGVLTWDGQSWSAGTPLPAVNDTTIDCASPTICVVPAAKLYTTS